VKKCTNCGQEIPSDSATCMYCGQAQPARVLGQGQRKLGYAAMGRLAILMAVAAVAMVNWLTGWKPATPDKRPARSTFASRSVRTLDVRVTRDAQGMEITSRETEPLSQCVVGVPDRGRPNQWTTVVQQLPPGQAMTVAWSQFRSPAGAVMPADIGPGARYATILCGNQQDPRKATVLPFR
jgi:hypothetical protein